MTTTTNGIDIEQHTIDKFEPERDDVEILTVLPFSEFSFTRQCKYTLFPKCVVTLTLLLGSSKYGNGSCVVVSSPSSISFSSGVSVNGEENSCQKFFGNESNGSPSRGFTTTRGERERKIGTRKKLTLKFIHRRSIYYIESRKN